MIDVSPLADIDSDVQVDLSRLELKRFSKDTLRALRGDPSGKVIDYKMTDGRGIGLILRLRDGSVNWFFDYEVVQPFEKNPNYINKVPKIEENYSFDDQLISLPFIKKIGIPKNNVNDISYIINPINFLSWLIYSVKDVF
tara:strand:- start:1656 stop:2075 length:420 start_codon:yes stop_codon:yes gene_type:complete